MATRRSFLTKGFGDFLPNVKKKLWDCLVLFTFTLLLLSPSEPWSATTIAYLVHKYALSFQPTEQMKTEPFLSSTFRDGKNCCFHLSRALTPFIRNDETNVLEMDNDWRRNKSKGVFGDFVNGTEKALQDISQAIPTSDDNFVTIQESCTLHNEKSLGEIVQHLTTLTSDDDEVNALVKEKLLKLQDFISTHAIHIILAGFRTVAAPGKWEFDIFACNLSEFRKFCRPRFMACAMKLAVCAFFGETPVPLQSDKVRELLKGSLPSTANASATSKASNKKSAGGSSSASPPVGKGPPITNLEELAKNHCELV